jgi:hypothetical protein
VHPSLTPASGPRVLHAELDARRPGIHLTAAARTSAGVVAMASALPLALSGPSLAFSRNTDNPLSPGPHTRCSAVTGRACGCATPLLGCACWRRPRPR